MKDAEEALQGDKPSGPVLFKKQIICVQLTILIRLR